MGTQSGVSFGNGVPVALTNGVLTSYEGCAVLSNNTGGLLAYTNGENIWDRTHQVMPNGGSGLGGNNSSSQTAVLLPAPNDTQRAYLFCVDAIENNMVGGLRYSIIDWNLHSGLGDITTKGIVLPTPVVSSKVTEKLTAVRHANGRDYWIVVHGWQSNTFYSFLLSPAGISTVPVVSNSGLIHQGGGSFFGAANAVGCMKVSPDGKHLALAQRDSQTELYDFNDATGSVSNYVSLGSWPLNYGIEFSPDNSRLYVSLALDGQIVQFNLLAGSSAAIKASGSIIGIGGRMGSLQRGPDGKIYVAIYNSNYLDVITNPNALGTACSYQTNVVSLAGRPGQNGLPNFPNAFAVNNVLAIAATFTSVPACAGNATTFTGTVAPAVSGATATWNFGDPASGTANTATGFTPNHTYAAAGTYQATLTVSAPGLTLATSTQTVTVLPLPSVQLGGNVTLCGSQLLLSPGAQPAGSTYRWQDGSVGATLLARTSGRYQVTVTSPAGCASTDFMQLTLNAVPIVRLPPDTLVCTPSVVLRPNTQPTGTLYRWQDGSTSPTYLAQATGTYSVLVTTPQGCTSTATSQVRLGLLPTVRLGADTLVCPSATWTLRTNPQPAGTLYRWQDGSTNPTYLAHGPGQYSVEVQATAASCPARATLTATGVSCPVFIPNIITPNGDSQNEFFVLTGLTPSEWHLVVFDRWGRQVYDQARYDNHWNAPGAADGLYYYLLSNTATGQHYQGWVQVQRGS